MFEIRLTFFLHFPEFLFLAINEYVTPEQSQDKKTQDQIDSDGKDCLMHDERDSASVQQSKSSVPHLKIRKRRIYRITQSVFAHAILLLPK